MTKKIRGFEIISKYEGEGVNLPARATKNAAGYDFQASEDVVIPSAIKAGLKLAKARLFAKFAGHENLVTEKDVHLKPTLVPTGIKAYMGDDEYLQLANRSSNPLKRFLLLANGVGVIDADYYNNESNEGHIMFQFVNFGLTDIHIKKGENIGQGTFLPFLKADGDTGEHASERTGGFGSTNK